MAFRGQRGTDPFSTKTSRHERFAQMSQQELLIEQKKKEIQEKLKQQKTTEILPNNTATPVINRPRETVIDTSGSPISRDNNQHNQRGNYRRPPQWRGNETKWKRSPAKATSAASSASSSLSNLFVNDGSFLDQFKKVAEGKETVNVLKKKDEKIVAHQDSRMAIRGPTNIVDTRPVRIPDVSRKPPERPPHHRPLSHSTAMREPSRNNPAPARPPSPYSPTHMSPDSSPQHTPHFEPGIPPPNLIHIPNLSQPPPLITPGMPPAIRPPVLLTPNIPPPLVSSALINIPPPALLTSQPPPLLQGMSIPPPNMTAPPPPVLPTLQSPFPFNIQNRPPPPLPTNPPQPIASTSVPLPTIPPPLLGNFAPQAPTAIMTEVSPAAPCPVGTGNNPTPAMTQLARMVAEGGDDIEDMARERNRGDPSMWFLYQRDSAAYKQYRDLVARIRSTLPENKEDNNMTAALDAASSMQLGVANVSTTGESGRPKKKRSRWGEKAENVAATPVPTAIIPIPTAVIPTPHIGAMKNIPPAPLLSKITRTDQNLLAYAMKSYGTTQLSEEDWKKCEDHYKVHLLYNEMVRKREQLAKLQRAGKHKYEYDSDEETDGGTWEHKLRYQEMEATERWADELTKQAEGKHHIGDFLPPNELDKFMEKYNAKKEGREPDLSDYKEYKLKEDNIGFKMLQKLGWSEGQGLGSEGQGITTPVNKATVRNESQGLGLERPDEVEGHDDEYEAYRKRMMLAYRFRPNPLNNPRRAYY